MKHEKVPEFTSVREGKGDQDMEDSEYFENGKQKSVFYTEGTAELRDARLRIA